MSITSDFLKRVDEAPPAWSDNIIAERNINKYQKYSQFVRRAYWTDSGSINVFCIRGTDHTDYQGLTWREFLHRGRRMDINIRLLEKNPSYYLGTEVKKPAMHYVSYNGLDWYVGSDGNHRSCLARFLFYEKGLTYLHGVSLRHYEFDDALLSVYEELQAERLCQQQAGLYWEIDLHSETLGREDTPGWKIDHYSPGFTLRLVGGLQGGDQVPESLRRVTVRQADEGRVLFQQIQSLRQMQIKPVTGAHWLNRWFRRGAK
ncbi:hypothetical protein S722_003826 [Salmonella enterica subsp. enterica serovar Oranienburg]|nr:hypothetical protein [Salmonella enterica]EBG5300052.1 hypothetical protein [Salmonella enterica subsp. enterica serovar Oranienburg]EBS0773063.1 hypothetical protein [Salmonella enterica subsp. enterica serovar Gaminara]ECZ5400047.1 hypothetical protein [Salmonella enterica subsp. enterica serovar Senftenberg]EEJ6668469.1 hypothetical protein [Salmonella enterica subsp. enterica]EGF6168101.1 hypothetical protein [Salmonella enterica subsp. enterica serovar Anatum]EGI6619484.1 hypothetical